MYGQATNVFKLFNLISVQGDPELKQRRYYLKGIGTYDVGNVWKKIYSIPEMAFAWFVPEEYPILQLIRSAAAGM